MRTMMLLIALLLPVSAAAGPVYGTIFFNDAPLKGASLTIVCGDQTVKGATLDDGSYRIQAPEGRCTLTASAGFGSASASVVSSSSAARYSFDVVKAADGYELRRQ